MKQLFTLAFFVSLFKLSSQCTYTLNLSSTNGFTVTCSNPTLNLNASANSTNAMTYLWTGPSFTSNLSTANITQPGSYTLVSTEGITNCTLSNVFSIGINTVVPISALLPATQTIGCNGLVTFTGSTSTPTANVLHEYFSNMSPPPGGAPLSSFNSTLSVYNFSLSPGTYTLRTTDLTNGCRYSTAAVVTSTYAYPTFSIASPTGFSLGCSPFNQTTISILNPISTQTPPATCSYTFLPPSFVGPLTQSIILGVSSSTVSSAPGTWSVVVQDNSNFCRSIQPVTLLTNTAAPHVSVSLASSTITCNQPQVLGIGSSTTSNTNIEWNWPGQVTPMSTPTLMLGPPNGPSTSTIALMYANYTVIVTNTLTACQTTSIISINQDFRKPVSYPAIIGTPTSICTPTDIVVLNSNNSYITSAGPGGTISVITWMGPAPQVTSAATTYSAFVSGVYSLTVRDTYNGCTSTGTVNVPTGAPIFGLQGTAPSTSVSCDGSVIITTQSLPGTYAISVSTGSLGGTTISNLCYGWLKVCLSYSSTGCYKCDSILINGATALAEVNLENEISVYPNPAHTFFNVKYNPNSLGVIRIYSVEGREIYSQRFETSGNSVFMDLKTGIYIVEISNGEAFLRKKIVIMD